VLCQTSLPYRDPGNEVRLWSRKNGYVRLEVQAGRAYDGRTDEFVDVGLPFGPKPRLVLYHLNAEALRNQSPEIELEDSLTAFVKRTLGLDAHGRNIRVVKAQLARLSAADFRIGVSTDDRSTTLKGSFESPLRSFLSVVSLLPNACRNAKGNSAASNGCSAIADTACSISTAFKYYPCCSFHIPLAVLKATRDRMPGAVACRS
jgi:hypothetical protein